MSVSEDSALPVRHAAVTGTGVIMTEMTVEMTAIEEIATEETVMTEEIVMTDGGITDIKRGCFCSPLFTSVLWFYGYATCSSIPLRCARVTP